MATLPGRVLTAATILERTFGWRRVFAVLLLWAATAIPSPAQTFTTLVRFAGTNGAGPSAGLVQGTDGTFYGTTLDLGANGQGTVFKVSPSGALKTLYSFGGLDGANPAATLIQAANGTFYGTTSSGGGPGHGTVFKITAAGVFGTVYYFVGPEGTDPSGLVQAKDGNFYLTTSLGGTTGYGAVVKITPGGALTTLYDFYCVNPTTCPNGTNPHAVLVQATNGNFYGTTSFGGAYGNGTVFKITPAGTITTLHSFCATYNSQGYCSDGGQTSAGLVQAGDGNFYGTTDGEGDNGEGTVFKITPGGTLTTLYSFGSPATDGGFPKGGLVQATDGNFYGTTSGFGANGYGTIFEITPAGTETTLHNFVLTADGGYPQAGLVLATDGNFYGTTYSGGTKGDGTVFRLATGLAPFVKTRPTSGKVAATVNVLGTNLTGATSVMFNGTTATFTVVSNSQIKSTVPAGATTGNVTVMTPGGLLTSNQKFRVTP